VKTEILTEDELVQIEVQKLIRADAISQALSADDWDSRPSPTQEQIILSMNGMAKYLFIFGGNQSIPKDNFILMADGTQRCISEVVEGDYVKVFDTKKECLVNAPVVKKWNNGIKPVYRWHFKHDCIDSTEKHEILQYDDETGSYHKKMLDTVNYVITPSRKHGVFYQPKIGDQEFVGNLQVYDLTVDHPDHNYICNNIVVGNSGKTTLILRLLTWAVEESSPYWRRPTDDICNNLQCNTKGIKRHQLGKDYECPKCGNVWTIWPKDQPINVMLIGEQLKNIQENLYEPRIKPLLMNPDEWEEDKLGSTFVQKITNTRTGNSILFFPHGHGAETARKAVQGYSVHYVFTDEQIPKKLIEELQRRVMAKLGIFVCGFTMKKLDAEVVRFVEAQVASGAAKRFYISMLDNPIYAGRKDMIEAQLAGLNEAERNVVLFGEVQFSDEYVFYQVDAEKIAKPVPPTYDAKKWRHVEIIDPAIKSKAGRVIIAQDPDTKIWHVIHVYLLKGMLHDKHLYEAHLALREKEGYDPILSVADDDAGFIGMARHHDTPTKFIFPKSKRAKGRGKLWLIKQTAGTLISGILHIDPKFTLLWDEIRSYQWKENSRTEIVNSHKYHLLDCIMYFIDSLPDEDVLGEIRKTYMQELLEFNHKVGFKSGLDNKKSSQGQRIVAIMKPSQVRIM
jgi:hypothetical protein